MANQYDDDDFDDEAVDNGPANLRRALKKAEKERETLKEELAGLKSNLRQRSVKDVLETKGVNPKIASFIPSSIEAPEQIAAWLDENADVFGFATQAQSETTETTENDAAIQRIESSTNSAVTPGRDADLFNKIASASSKEELAQLMGHSTNRFR
jgi:hypothetical protein